MEALQGTVLVLEKANSFNKLMPLLGFSGGSDGKESTCNAGDVRDSGSIPELGTSSGGGHGNSLQYSCLENPMDRGAWQATVHGVPKSRTQLTNTSEMINRSNLSLNACPRPSWF